MAAHSLGQHRSTLGQRQVSVAFDRVPRSHFMTWQWQLREPGYPPALAGVLGVPHAVSVEYLVDDLVLI